MNASLAPRAYGSISIEQRGGAASVAKRAAIVRGGYVMPAPTRYPLQWPEGWKRTRATSARPPRSAARARPLPFSMACSACWTSCSAWACTKTMWWCRPTCRRAWMAATQQSDTVRRPGRVRVLEATASLRCMAVDYDEVKDNLAAVAATLEGDAVH